MKAKKPISADIREAIGLAAYHIWEREGRPHGRQDIHWKMAEAEILSEPPADKAVLAKSAKKAATKKTVKAASPKAAEKAPKAKAEGPKKIAVAAKTTTKKKASKSG